MFLTLRGLAGDRSDALLDLAGGNQSRAFPLGPPFERLITKVSFPFLTAFAAMTHEGFVSGLKVR